MQMLEDGHELTCARFPDLLFRSKSRKDKHIWNYKRNKDFWRSEGH